MRPDCLHVTPEVTVGTQHHIPLHQIQWPRQISLKRLLQQRHRLCWNRVTLFELSELEGTASVCFLQTHTHLAVLMGTMTTCPSIVIEIVLMSCITSAALGKKILSVFRFVHAHRSTHSSLVSVFPCCFLTNEHTLPSIPFAVRAVHERCHLHATGRWVTAASPFSSAWVRARRVSHESAALAGWRT